MPKRRVSGSLDEVQEITFQILEKQHAPAASGRLYHFSHSHTFAFQFPLCDLNRLDAQRQVTPAVQFVIRRFLHAPVTLVNFNPSSPRKFDDEGRRRFSIVEDDAGAQDAFIPVLQRGRVLGGQPYVFERKLNLHGSQRGQKRTGRQTVKRLRTRKWVIDCQSFFATFTAP